MSVVPYDDTRKDWGANPPKNGGHRVVGKDAKIGVTAHWAGPKVSIEPSDPHSKCLSLVKAWQVFHMGPSRGWRDLGYQILVCVHGNIIEGAANGPYTSAACNAGANTPWVCVQFMRGEGDKTGLNEKMKAAGKRVYDALVKDTGRTLQRNGHRDVVGTSCPGNEIQAWWTAPTLIGGNEEFEMDKNDIYNAVWRTDDKMEATVPTEDNAFWWPENVVERTAKKVLSLEAQGKVILAEVKMNRAAFEAAIQALVDAIGTGVDPEKITQMVEAKVDEALAGVKVEFSRDEGDAPTG